MKFFERDCPNKKNRPSKPLVPVIAMSAGLLACGTPDEQITLPEGAKLPTDYSYMILVGEDNSVSVKMYSDTRPNVTGESGAVILEFTDEVFCPAAEARFADEETQTYEKYRDNYCVGDGLYDELVVSVGNGRTAVIPQGN